MLHCGAQGDQPISIAFFLSLGLDINSKDKRESTPLHWAAFAGSDLALTYIIAQGADVNARDIKLLTPLHLAVKASEKILTTRSIRALLLKGADPSLQDQDGKLPVDFLHEFDTDPPLMIEFIQEISELVRDDSHSLMASLNPFKDCECFELKQKFKKNGKSSKMMFFYFVLMNGTFILLNLYIYPQVMRMPFEEGGRDEPLFPWVIAQVVLFVVVSILSIELAFMDPGYLRPEDPQYNQINFFELLKNQDPTTLCFEC